MEVFFLDYLFCFKIVAEIVAVEDIVPRKDTSRVLCVFSLDRCRLAVLLWIRDNGLIVD